MAQKTGSNEKEQPSAQSTQPAGGAGLTFEDAGFSFLSIGLLGAMRPVLKIARCVVSRFSNVTSENHLMTSSPIFTTRPVNSFD